MYRSLVYLYMWVKFDSHTVVPFCYKVMAYVYVQVYGYDISV